MRRRWKELAAMMVAAMAMVVAPTAEASSADVAVLLTQVVDGAIEEADEEVAFWWQGSEEPRWTASDQWIFEALEDSGVDVARPAQVEISRIYQRPGLSRSNAAQMGTLLDVDRVLVGEVEYRPISANPPLNYAGIEARAKVDLVPAGDAEGVSMERFEITRQVYGPELSGLWQDSTEALGKALGEAMGHHLRRTGAEVGAGDGDRSIVLRNVERAQYLDEVRASMQALEVVASVRPRWASEGIVALAVIAGDGVSQRQATAEAMHALESEQFEAFDLRFSDESSVSSSGEVWLEPRSGATF